MPKVVTTKHTSTVMHLLPCSCATSRYQFFIGGPNIMAATSVNLRCACLPLRSQNDTSANVIGFYRFLRFFKNTGEFIG